MMTGKEPTRRNVLQSIVALVAAQNIARQSTQGQVAMQSQRLPPVDRSATLIQFWIDSQPCGYVDDVTVPGLTFYRVNDLPFSDTNHLEASQPPEMTLNLRMTLKQLRRIKKHLLDGSFAPMDVTRGPSGIHFDGYVREYVPTSMFSVVGKELEIDVRISLNGVPI